jgi:hypothetical protein
MGTGTKVAIGIGAAVLIGGAAYLALTKAQPAQNHVLTIVSTSGGSTNPSGVNSYPAGTIINIQITPDSGNSIGEIDLDNSPVSGAPKSLSVTMDADHTVNVIFISGSGGGGGGGGGGVSTGIPYTIETVSYPSSLSQQIALMRGSGGNNCLNYKPAVTINGDILSQSGYADYWAVFKVVDAAGKPVPNTPIQITCNQSTDNQGGKLLINGILLTNGASATFKTDNDGKISVNLQYHETEPSTIQILARNSGVFCGALGFKIGDLGYPGCCGWGLAGGLLPEQGFPYFTNKKASTTPQAYYIHLEVQNAPGVAANIGFQAIFNSTCLWS